jgi:acyl-CoA thioester hydrolase
MITKKIYYHDTDAGGVVYYANYLKYLEEARTEYFEQKGISIKNLHNEGFMYAVRKCEIVYKKPARYGDTVICTAEIEKMTAAQIFFNQKIHLKEDNQLLVESKISLVSLNKDFKATAIPENIRAKLKID